MTASDSIPGQDRYWMQRALGLARRGIALCSPNPVVGCVILDSAGQLAGEGWHEYDRLDHAEIMALKAARRPIPSEDLRGEAADRMAVDRVRGGTAYVTLEPCCITGRTPPCTQALIAAGLARVVAATIDPNPAVAGRGLKALQAAGLQTTVGVCGDEARRLNEGFARWSRSKRPFVLMKAAMTLDGRIAPPSAGALHGGFSPLKPVPGEQKRGKPFWITSETSRQAVQQLRWQADAVLTGIGTVLADDPLLSDRSGQRRRRPLLRVVLDSALRIPLDSKLVKTAAHDLLIFTVSSDETRLRELTARGVRVEVLDADSSQVPLGQALDKLGAEGILTLLTETGTRLNTALLAGGFVDRIYFFVSPQIMGSGAVPAFDGLDGSIAMADVEVERHGNDLGLTSLLRDPWPSVRTA